MAIGLGAVLSTVPSVAIRTFFRHYFRYSEQLKESEARSELTFDEAFWVIKAFLEKATTYTVEEVQSFCNTEIPHPPWVTVVKCVVPAETCVVAARVIVEHLGEDECDRVAGGQTWWQRRARSDGGVECEWISMRKDWTGDEYRESPHANKIRHKHATKVAAQEYRKTLQEKDLPPQYTPDMDESPRTMLYIHGGAHYVCSLNTHRYAIWRYARKMGGRAFGVTYRLSPQYPWPCALQDCLAAYLYLIRPPPLAKHQPVDPNRIIFAGDSAGGGLALALMCLIRDMELPMPACGVLISPWVDMTHSFPSILQNTATDIIMPYGFIHKPSALWPPPDSSAREAIDAAFHQAQDNGESHKSKDIKRDAKRQAKARKEVQETLANTPLYSSNRSSRHTSGASTPQAPLTVQEGGVQTLQKEGDGVSSSVKTGVKQDAAEKDAGDHPNENIDEDHKPAHQGQNAQQVNEGDRAEPAAVIRLQVDGELVEVKEQIQLYATNAQLTHPLVSPALQPSLGGLPPLLIIAGEKEVLRDEIIYVAHRAAHPDRYPLRQELLDQQPAAVKRAQHYKPTSVHLQVYDGACHVIPMFSFTTPAKYSFRSIASFCVSNTTTANVDDIKKSVGSDSKLSGNAISESVIQRGRRASLATENAASSGERHYGEQVLSPVEDPQSTPEPSAQNGRDSPTGPIRKSHSVGGNRHFMRYLTMNTGGKRRKSMSPAHSSSTGYTDPRTRTIKKRDLKRLDQTIYTETQPLHRPPYVDHMIRERVAVNGKVRPLEAEAEIPALQMKPDDIGVVKEGPVKRYLEGKALWDKRYKKTYVRIKRERTKHVKMARQQEASRLRSYLQKKSAGDDEMGEPEEAQALQSKGVWDLGDERPPPSSIAARKDLAEALRLAKVVEEQRESMSHPLALWNELHDLTWLRRENRGEGDDSEVQENADDVPATEESGSQSQSNGEAQSGKTDKPVLHVNTQGMVA